MIISASYKTDIPAFYGEWFLNRLKAGYCKVINPYNRFASKVNLTESAVDGFVFWTKNAAPFLSAFSEVDRRGYAFIVQHTINAYPRSLETSVVDWEKAVDTFSCLSERFGPERMVWRYDTILVSSETPIDFHRANFWRLASSLAGTTDEVVVSFAQIYKKTKSNLNAAADAIGLKWEDPADEIKYELATELAEMAKANGMQLTMCSQKAYLAPGVEEARCIDAKRLERVAGKLIPAKLKGNRDECGCYASKDIGEYDTCPHGCIYCYAVRNRQLALQRYKQHNPESEFLFEPDFPVKEQPDESKVIQMSLL